MNLSKKKNTLSFVRATPTSSNRKRAFSNPQIASISVPLQPSHLYYFDKSRSGRSSFCVNESLWPNTTTITNSDGNLFATTLANEEDPDEAIDQFSPTLYNRISGQAISRAIPIPNSSSSADNSPQHHHYYHHLHHHHHAHQQQQLQQQQQQQQQQQRSLSTGSAAPAVAASASAAASAAAVGYMAFSASPTGFIHAYSPFYGSSPDTLCSPGSFSYDPEFGPGIHRLQVPNNSSSSYNNSNNNNNISNNNNNQRRILKSPLDCATIMAVNRSVLWV
ncbi:hypothetical protein ACLKA6_000801 [Drosophila palustris]